MSKRLEPEGFFPSMKLNLVNGNTLTIPEDFTKAMTVVLFYQGHWSPYCRKLLLDFEELRKELLAEGVGILAVSVDTLEQAKEVAADVGFPVAYGLTRADGDAIGAWWQETDDHIYPSEFVLSQRGKVMMSTYTNSPTPISRIAPDGVLALMKQLNAEMAEANKS